MSPVFSTCNILYFESGTEQCLKWVQCKGVQKKHALVYLILQCPEGETPICSMKQAQHVCMCVCVCELLSGDTLSQPQATYSHCCAERVDPSPAQPTPSFSPPLGSQEMQIHRGTSSKWVGWVFMHYMMSEAMRVHWMEPWAIAKREKEELMSTQTYYYMYACTHTQSHVYMHTYLRALAEISGALLPAKLIIMKLL